MGKPKHPKVYSKNQIKKIKESGKLVAEVLRLATALCQEGKTTLSIDKSIDNFIKKNKAKSIKGYKNYTFNSCISIDEVILHGIPSKTKIKEGTKYFISPATRTLLTTLGCKSDRSRYPPVHGRSGILTRNKSGTLTHSTGLKRL